MKAFYVIASMIVLMILAGAVALQVKVSGYGGSKPVPQAAVQPHYARPIVPTVERLRSPHIVLVLDISASMKDSDSDHIQTEAVLQLYRVYSQLSTEILSHDEKASVAVVLFSTIAQVIDWGGKNPWLEAREENYPEFQRVMIRYLGTQAPEVRRGQDTDYMAALQEVDSLTSDLMSPPAVVFLTDGRNDPYPLFTPLLNDNERLALAGTAFRKHSELISQVASGRYRFIAASGNQEAFDRKALGVVGRIPFAPEQTRRMPGIISDRIRSLLGRKFRVSQNQPDTCMMWAPIFLGPGGEVDDSRAVLAGDNCGIWPTREKFVQCRDPHDLPLLFVRTLATWFRLQERPIAPGARELQVPSETKAFALQLKTNSETSSIRLTSSSGGVSLGGSNGIWAGVARGGGNFAINLDTGSVQSGRLFFRPRYDWLLYLPSTSTVTRQDAQLELQVFLFDLETEKPVDAHSVYSRLPAELPMRVRLRRGNRSSDIKLHLVGENSAHVAYAASLPVGDIVSDTVEAEVSLLPLADYGVPTSLPVLTSSIDVHPGVDLRIRTDTGDRALIEWRSIPLSSQRIQQFLGRLRGR